MATCQHCKHTFASTGSTCPKCGHAIPYLSRNMNFSNGALIVGTIVSGILVYVLSPPYPFVLWPIGGIVLAYAWAGVTGVQKQ